MHALAFAQVAIVRIIDTGVAGVYLTQNFELDLRPSTRKKIQGFTVTL